MRKAVVLLATLLGFVVHDAHAGGQVQCNSDKRRIRCEVPISVASNGSTCTATAPNIDVRRHVNNQAILLVWVLDDGSGSAQGFQFDSDGGKKGVEIGDYAGHFQHVGPEDAAKRYRWLDRNPPGGDLTFSYDFHVQQRINRQWQDCATADPLIVNRD